MPDAEPKFFERDTSQYGIYISGRNEGGGYGGLNTPKCARKCANSRNIKANVQILDRKTPPNVLPYFAY